MRLIIQNTNAWCKTARKIWLRTSHSLTSRQNELPLKHTEDTGLTRLQRVSKGGNSTSFLRNLCQFLTIFRVRKVSLHSNLNLLGYKLILLLLLSQEHIKEKGLSSYYSQEPFTYLKTYIPSLLQLRLRKPNSFLT